MAAGSLRASWPAPPGARLLLGGLAGLGLLAVTGAFAAHAAAVLAFPWALDYDEGIVVHDAWLLAHGANLYAPDPPAHFVSAIYPPVYYLVSALLLHLGGLSLAGGRAISVIATLGAGGALAAWVRAETGQWGGGLAAAALWLGLGPVVIWGSFYKPDLLALALGLAGGAWVAARPWGWHRYGALALLLAAVATKQTAVAPLIATFLFLREQDPWGAGRWLLVAGSVLGGGLLLLAAGSNGGVFAHLRAAADLALTHSLGMAAVLGGAAWPLGGLASGYVAWVRRRQARDGWAAVPLSAWYAIASLPVLLGATLHPVTNYNHLLLGLAPLCLVGGVAAGRAWRVVGTLYTPALRIGVLGLLGAQAVWSAAVLPPAVWHPLAGGDLAPVARQMAALATQVQATPGPVLAEDDWLLLRAGQPIPYDDDDQERVRSATGAWNPAQLVADVATTRFRLVITQFPLAAPLQAQRWPPAVLAALRTHYVLVAHDLRYVYAPRSGAGGAAP